MDPPRRIKVLAAVGRDAVLSATRCARCAKVYYIERRLRVCNPRDRREISTRCSTWSHLVTPGHTWALLVAPGRTQSHLGTPSHSWSPLTTPSRTWPLLVAPGHSWSHPGHTRRDSCVSHKSLLCNEPFRHSQTCGEFSSLGHLSELLFIHKNCVKFEGICGVIRCKEAKDTPNPRNTLKYQQTY